MWKTVETKAGEVWMVKTKGKREKERRGGGERTEEEERK